MCVHVCEVDFARQAASSMPVGGGVSSPDTGCLYYSVYYWHSATQLSSDLWIGMVCIYSMYPNEWLFSANAEVLHVSVCVYIYFIFVCVHV